MIRRFAEGNLVEDPLLGESSESIRCFLMVDTNIRPTGDCGQHLGTAQEALCETRRETL